MYRNYFDSKKNFPKCFWPELCLIRITTIAVKGTDHRKAKWGSRKVLENYCSNPDEKQRGWVPELNDTDSEESGWIKWLNQIYLACSDYLYLWWGTGQKSRPSSTFIHQNDGTIHWTTGIFFFLYGEGNGRNIMNSITNKLNLRCIYDIVWNVQ